jgi:hypothetical protein
MLAEPRKNGPTSWINNPCQITGTCLNAVSRWDAELNPRSENMKTLPPLQELSAFVPQGSTFLEAVAFLLL